MFYDKLQEACKLKGLKITPLVKELNLSTGSPTAWKSGVLPNSRTVQLLAERLDVTVGWLMGEEEPDTPNAAKELSDAFNSLTADELEVLEAYRKYPDVAKKVVRRTLGLEAPSPSAGMAAFGGEDMQTGKKK